MDDCGVVLKLQDFTSVPAVCAGERSMSEPSSPKPQKMRHRSFSETSIASTKPTITMINRSPAPPEPPGRCDQQIRFGTREAVASLLPRGCVERPEPSRNSPSAIESDRKPSCPTPPVPGQQPVDPFQLDRTQSRYRHKSCRNADVTTAADTAPGAIREVGSSVGQGDILLSPSTGCFPAVYFLMTAGGRCFVVA